MLHLSGLSLGLSVRLGLGLSIVYLIECSESCLLVHIALTDCSILMLIKLNYNSHELHEYSTILYDVICYASIWLLP